MPRENAELISPACPRCGYDQRGVIGTWTDHCPLQGMCSECGLKFDFGELLAPNKYEPRWCVEFVLSDAHVPRAVVVTFFRSGRPWRFWTTIRMAFPVRVTRLQIYALSLILLCLATHLIQQTALTYRAWTTFKQEVAAATRNASPVGMMTKQLDELKQYLAGYQRQLRRYDEMESQGRVPSHVNLEVARNYVLAAMEVLEHQIEAVEQQLQAARIAPPPAPPASPPVLKELFRAIVTPRSQEPGPSVTIMTGPTLVYPSPEQLYLYTGAIVVGPIAGVTSHLRQSWFWWSPLLLVPAGFVLLPISRRRANVQWIHIIRILVYSIAIPIGACMIATFAASAALLVPRIASIASPLVTLLPYGGVTILLALWWAAAIGRYLRLPHAWAVSTLFSILSLLLSVTLAGYIVHPMSPGEFWHYLLTAFE